MTPEVLEKIKAGLQFDAHYVAVLADRAKLRAKETGDWSRYSELIREFLSINKQIDTLFSLIHLDADFRSFEYEALKAIPNTQKTVNTLVNNPQCLRAWHRIRNEAKKHYKTDSGYTDFVEEAYSLLMSIARGERQDILGAKILYRRARRNGFGVEFMLEYNRILYFIDHKEMRI